MYADPEGWMLGANNAQGEGDESGERAVMEEFDEGEFPREECRAAVYREKA